MASLSMTRAKGSEQNGQSALGVVNISEVCHEDSTTSSTSTRRPMGVMIQRTAKVDPVIAMRERGRPCVTPIDCRPELPKDRPSDDAPGSSAAQRQRRTLARG
jgi:hypothetical protein